jgi:hypothetical protein
MSTALIANNDPKNNGFVCGITHEPFRLNTQATRRWPSSVSVRRQVELSERTDTCLS